MKLAKQKNKEGGKKEAMSALQSHKRLICFLLLNYSFFTTLLVEKHKKHIMKIFSFWNQKFILLQIYHNLTGLESNKHTHY